MNITSITLEEARGFAALMVEWATAEYESKRLGYNWQRASARQWLLLSQLAVIATFPAPPRDLRHQARRIARESRSPKVRGVMRRGFRALSLTLFAASRNNEVASVTCPALAQSRATPTRRGSSA